MTASQNQIAQRLEEQVTKTRRAVIDELGPAALAWLALPPLWTGELAASVGFPRASLAWEDFLPRCEELGWCVRRTAPVAGRHQDAAEILVGLAETLRAGTPDTAAWRRAAEAAVELIYQIPAPALRQSLLGRLGDVPVTSTVTGSADPEDELSPPRKQDPYANVLRLIARQDRPELAAVIAAASPADLQRIMLGPGHDLPSWVQEFAVFRTARICTPRVAARVLAETAAKLPPRSVRLLVEQLLDLVHPGQRGAEAAIASLATAAGYAGDNHTAFELCDRLTDDLLRASVLAAMAGKAAAGTDQGLTHDIVDRIRRVVVSGEAVDLAGAADAVERLATAGGLSAAMPIVHLVSQRLRADYLSPPDIGALVKLAAVLREGGYDADTFVTEAEQTARTIADPATRSAGLARILRVADASLHERLIIDALRSARDVTQAIDRARALARLAAHLPSGQRQPIVEEVISVLRFAELGDAFWMPDGVRADILGEFEQLEGLPWLREHARQIGNAVLNSNWSLSAPPALRRWAVLAVTLRGEDETGDEVGRTLLDQVQPLLRSGFIAEALSWIETGRKLLTIVKGALDTSLLVAARSAELTQRTADDRRLLQRFLPRKEPLAAFRELLETNDRGEPWALHYLGASGMGKTMLLRHISAELAPAQQFAVARVDFDRLSPDFPLKRPGQLLLYLLEELEAYATPDTRELYENARKVLLYLGLPPTGEPDGVPSTLGQAVESFCAYLEALGSRIVLILDTCEELSKFEPVGSVLPQVEAAFRLLERINHEVPAVRVIFAGRRPLAHKVHGGREIALRRSLDCLPDEKTYLKVHEITGFTDEEARRYLTEMEGLKLTEAVANELLDLSRSVTEESAYVASPGMRHRPSRARPVTERIAYHIPFDLTQYAAALRENPDYLKSAQRNLAYATYVRDRIAERLERITAQILPAVVVMRRFDREMLAVAVGGVPGVRATAEEAWQELSPIEWIFARPDRELKTTFLEVDRTMLERLQSYYAAPGQRPAYDKVRRGLAGGLAELVRNRPLDGLAVDHVDAALRCLSPREGAGLCDDLTLRAAAGPGAWTWAYHVFSQVLGLDGALADPGQAALAVGMALYATALSKVSPAADLRPQWQRVATLAARHPDVTLAGWLTSRANLLAHPQDTQHWVEAMGRATELLKDSTGDQRRAIWLAGTILAAASRCLDLTGGERSVPAEGREVLRAIAGATFGSQVAVVATVLLARALLLDNCEIDATVLFARAIVTEEAAGPVPTTDADPSGTDVDAASSVPEATADGGVPSNLRDWVRLEVTLANLPGLPQDPGTRNQWLTDALDTIRGSTEVGQVADPDSDRLSALLLSLSLNERPLPASLLADVQDAIGSQQPPAPRTLTHRQVPALRVVLSRAWLVLAETDRARETLGPPGTFSETVPAAVQRELDLARVEIARRMRLPMSDRGVRLHLRETCSIAEAPRVYEAMSLLGEDPPSPPELFRPPAHLHAWWRAMPDPVPGTPIVPTRPVAAPADLRNAFQVARQWCPADRPGLYEALHLDQEELRLLDKNDSVEHWEPPAPATAVPGPYRSPDADEQVWRQALRRDALAGRDVKSLADACPAPGRASSQVPEGSGAPANLPRLGARQRAELALDEGELLALRIPAAGAVLLRAAHRWFEEADDPVGALISLTAERMAVARETQRWPDLAKLMPTYERVLREHPGLPSWSDLGDRTRYTQAIQNMEQQVSLTWEGWLLGLRWLCSGASPSWRGVDPRRTAIPPEIGIRKSRSPAGSIPPGAPQGGLMTARQVVRRLRATPAHSRRRRILVSLIGVTAALGVLYGIVLLYGLITSAVGGLPLLNTTVLRILLYIILITAVIEGLFLIASMGPGNSGAVIAIDPGPSPAAVSVAIIALTGRPWPLPMKQRTVPVEDVAMLNLTTPERSQTRIHDLLHSTARLGVLNRVSLRAAGLWDRRSHPTSRPAQTLRVSLLVAGPLAGVAWEAWLGAPLGDIDMYLGRPYRALLGTAAEPISELSNTCWVLAPPRWRSLVRNAVPVTTVVFPDEFPEHAAHDVVIAIATAVQTQAGRRLVIHNGKSREHDLVIDPDEVSLAGLTVVVAGEPRPGPRRASAKRSAAALRTCAADLMEAGARTVIVLPNLPSAVTAQVLGCLASALRPGQRYTAVVLSEAVDQARRVLAEEGRQKNDPELGYELTVMSRALP